MLLKVSHFDRVNSSKFNCDRSPSFTFASFQSLYLGSLYTTTDIMDNIKVSSLNFLAPLRTN